MSSLGSWYRYININDTVYSQVHENFTSIWRAIVGELPSLLWRNIVKAVDMASIWTA